MDYIIIMALCEKLRHWRYLSEKDPVIAGEYWKNEIMGVCADKYWFWLAPLDISALQVEREYTQLIDSMLETDLNKFNRSFFASEYVIDEG